jgi:hypothetical protein
MTFNTDNNCSTPLSSFIQYNMQQTAQTKTTRTDDYQLIQPPNSMPRLVPLTTSVITGTVLSIAWIFTVNHIVNTTTVPGDTQHWTTQARNAYGLCYDGCNDCLDVRVIEDACRMTTRLDLDCDARNIWFWEDRYPDECLYTLGQLLQDDELKSKQFKLRFLYLLIAVPIALAWALYHPAEKLVRWIQAQDRRRKARRHVQSDDAPRSSTTGTTTPLLRTATISILAIALFYTTPVSAYACTNFHPVHNQPFVSQTDPTLFGNIHGWLSDCYRESYSCGQRCDFHHNTTSCSTQTCYRKRADASPADFVRDAAKKVAGCGFEMVDVIPGIASRRVANPRIEGDLWVKISVNRYNGSSGVERGVLCLGDLVGWP